jgi:hypothetical protein
VGQASKPGRAPPTKAAQRKVELVVVSKALALTLACRQKGAGGRGQEQERGQPSDAACAAGVPPVDQLGAARHRQPAAHKAAGEWEWKGRAVPAARPTVLLLLLLVLLLVLVLVLGILVLVPCSPAPPVRPRTTHVPSGPSWPQLGANRPPPPPPGV